MGCGTKGPTTTHPPHLLLTPPSLSSPHPYHRQVSNRQSSLDTTGKTIDGWIPGWVSSVDRVPNDITPHATVETRMAYRIMSSVGTCHCLSCLN